MKKILLVLVMSVFLMSFVASQEGFTCSNAPDSFTELGTNRWMLNYETESETFVFVTNSPIGKGPSKSYFDLQDSRGFSCNCADILTILNLYDPVLYGEMEGQWKYGCSSSIMDAFVALGLGPEE